MDRHEQFCKDFCKPEEKVSWKIFTFIIAGLVGMGLLLNGLQMSSIASAKAEAKENDAFLSKRIESLEVTQAQELKGINQKLSAISEHFKLKIKKSPVSMVGGSSGYEGKTGKVGK